MHPELVSVAHHLEPLLSHRHTQMCWQMSTRQTWHYLLMLILIFKHTDNFDLCVVSRLSNFSPFNYLQLDLCDKFPLTNKRQPESLQSLRPRLFVFFFLFVCVFVIYFESGQMLIVGRLCLRSRNNNNSSSGSSKKPGRSSASRSGTISLLVILTRQKKTERYYLKVR